MKIRISDNNRYFVNEDDTPFTWLADTAWTMPQRMKWDDVVYYMKKRKEQGFTVLQIVALDPEMDEQMCNPAGKKALLENNPLAPNEAYFEYLDWILDQAEHYGFHVLLLPVWGQLVVGHNWMGQTFEKTVTKENAFEYGQWIGSRYKDRSNLVWCLGGDRQPIHLGVDYKNVWRRMAEGLAKGLTGKQLKYNEAPREWRELLITYHACHEMETGKCSTMSYWTDEDAWISFIMLQSGHGLKPKNYELVKAEYDRAVTMPVWDGEPAYEMMPTTWPEMKNLHGDWMVRKRAYWSLFSGSFGHTYGHASVWCMISEKERNAFTRYTWYEALQSKGAAQMKILRDFMESRDLSSCKPDENLVILVDAQELCEKTGDLDGHIQTCRDEAGTLACSYFPMGGTVNIDLTKMQGEQFNLWWFNPRDGRCCNDENMSTDEAILIKRGDLPITVKTPTSGAKEDWILIIDAAELLVGIPGEAQTYYREEKAADLKKVFEWQ